MELIALILAISSSEKNSVTSIPPALDSIAELTNRFLAVFDGPNSTILTTPNSPMRSRTTAVRIHIPTLLTIFNAILFFVIISILSHKVKKL